MSEETKKIAEDKVAALKEKTAEEAIDAATTIVPTGDVKPAAPGETAPAASITEEERAQLAEAWHEVRAAKNAVVALQAEAGRLDAERRVAEAEARAQSAVGQQLEQVVQRRLEQLRQKYNIPDGWQIDSKSGLVAEAPAKDATAGVVGAAVPAQ
ncbi:hypothetical protein LCGC14_0919350 [marine sediment metagenome]|uniref:Uncharacterized protein n=1 Tax=marine sediment metagenome TaxID=412755 RepID=A0A0F9NW31_9ZZZZ